MGKIDPSEPALTQTADDPVTPDLRGIAAWTLEPQGLEPSVSTGLRLIGSTEPQGGCEPSVSDRFFVSSIARSLTTSDLSWQAEPLSHPEPGRRSGARSLSYQGDGSASSPDPRNQPVSDSLGVLLVARQFRLEGPVLPGSFAGPGAGTTRMAGIRAHREPSAKGMPRKNRKPKCVSRMPDDGVGTGVDDPVTSVGLDADGRLEELVHRRSPGEASHPNEHQGIAQSAAPPRHVGPVIPPVIQGRDDGIAIIVGRKPKSPRSRSQRLGHSWRLTRPAMTSGFTLRR